MNQSWRLLLLILIICVLALAACQRTQSDPTAEITPTPTEITGICGDCLNRELAVKKILEQTAVAEETGEGNPAE